jgi:hypothetical protein
MTAIPLPATAATTRAAPKTWDLTAFAQAIWRALEATGQRRAARELQRRAAEYATWNPAVAADLRAAAARCLQAE